MMAMSLTDSAVDSIARPPEPLAMRADDTGSAAPVLIYPPGFDFSNFLIFEPSSREWVSGAGVSREAVLLAASPSYGTMDGPVPGPLDGGSGGGTNSMDPPETGFYQVVQDGVQIANSSITNLTSGALSGTVNITFEAGNADANNGTNLIGTLSSATLIIDGEKYPAGASLNAKNRPWKYVMDTAYLDEQMLRQFLSRTNSRNFYYDGHGDLDNIVSSSLDATMLKATIQHRYRFVFLNGCNTANGDLDAAFGINGPRRYDIDYYHKSGIRPGAFMGYDVEVQYAEGGPVVHGGVTYDDTIPWQVPGFITNFLFYWDTDLIGYGLLSAIDNAKSGLPPVNGQYREDHLKIHGFFNLHIDEVNHRYDTW
jgi:hypothetical protein